LILVAHDRCRDSSYKDLTDYYVFGGLLILTAIKMLLTQTDEVDPEKNPLVRIARRLYPVTSDFHEQKFFTYIDGKRALPRCFVLLSWSTDVLFAVDSIPAIFAITSDPFPVFTSNVFAILGVARSILRWQARCNTFAISRRVWSLSSRLSA
jgi:predicted tellurium resistance membrane protein TerC